VVPARHFCHVFAGEVNRICSDPATRPEAIAVELGPAITGAAREWLGQLGVGPGNRRTLPVMLGLIRPNRMIRASLKQKAIRLQKESGRDLSELPAEVLHRELGFSDHLVLFLSPTDSIIEAVRCALELGVPAFGMDLEETAGGIYQPAIIEDPQSSRENLGQYMVKNLPLADATRDLEIDLRREVAMAARLKALLLQHRRVLFTCGMAHWLKIGALLEDESILPSPVSSDSGQGCGNFRRVVVHPLVAARHMDLFPALVKAYERSRMPAGSIQESPKINAAISASAIFHAQLKKVYRSYFARRLRAVLPGKQNADLESLPLFEGYLRGLCQLNHCQVPDLFTIVQGAQETMSADFVKAVINTFMNFPWTSPRDHSGCTLLLPPMNQVPDPGCAMLVDSEFRAERRIFFSSVPAAGQGPTCAEIPYEWQEAGNSWQHSMNYTWRPWEHLISAMTFQAIQEGMERRPRRKTVDFEGSLLDGIDVKSTLRAFSRGDDSLFVRDFRYGEIPRDANPIDGFPVVWILNPGKHCGAEWKILHEPSNFMECHIRDRAVFRRIVETRGGQMVAIIAYGFSQSAGRLSSKGQDIRADHYHGILVFQPLCWTNRQFARWAELTRYRKNPFCRDTSLNSSSPSELRDFFEHAHGISLGSHDWTTTMILMALPFTKEFLTVVIPEDYRIEGVVHEMARRCGVKVIAAPLKIFQPEQISRLAVCQLVPVISVEPESVYPAAIERAIKESPDQNRHLVPREWLDFGAGR
jgi:hypothetical protein